MAKARSSSRKSGKKRHPRKVAANKTAPAKIGGGFDRDSGYYGQAPGAGA